jgi:Uncharacterized protein conserved in bacteria
LKYMLMIYRDEAVFAPGQTSGAHSGAYVAYADALKAAGILVGGDRLQPSTTASTVRAGNGAPEILDGPYADTKEQFGGFYIIDVPDLDAALQWAARCPGAAQGAIEVRPMWVI